METTKLSSIGLHKLTETHPVMSEEQFNAFKNDIEKRGQLQPVLVYRGKIVDGRHRYRALTLLGCEDILISKLSNNLTLDEVLAMVNSTEMRRHQSPTQLAIKGYRQYKSGELTQREIPAIVGCSLANLKHVIALETLGRLDIIELLEAGGKMNISRDSRFSKMSDSLLAVVTYVKEELAKLESLQTESEEDSETKVKLSSSEIAQLQAVELITASWTEPLKKTLIAKLYQSFVVS